MNINLVACHEKQRLCLFMVQHSAPSSALPKKETYLFLLVVAAANWPSDLKEAGELTLGSLSTVCKSERARASSLSMGRRSACVPLAAALAFLVRTPWNKAGTQQLGRGIWLEI